jgi:hypothetical protein
VADLAWNDPLALSSAAHLWNGQNAISIAQLTAQDITAMFIVRHEIIVKCSKQVQIQQKFKLF